MSTRRHASHLSAPLVDALLAEKLDGGLRGDVEAHLAACPRCRDELGLARAARCEFGDVVLPRTIARVRSRLEPARGRWAWLAALSAATAAVVIIVVGLRLGVPRQRSLVEPALATKGGPSLRVVARRDGRVFAVSDGTRLRAGDELRFVVAGSDARYLLIASIDGDGQATIYYPFDGAASAALDARDKRVELPGSIVLDGARGPERLFALFSDAPLPAARVRAALGRLGAAGPAAIRAATKLPDEPAEQLSILFDKESP